MMLSNRKHCKKYKILLFFKEEIENKVKLHYVYVRKTKINQNIVMVVMGFHLVKVVPIITIMNNQ